jgi:hypothetical protein
MHQALWYRYLPLKKYVAKKHHTIKDLLSLDCCTKLTKLNLKKCVIESSSIFHLTELKKLAITFSQYNTVLPWLTALKIGSIRNEVYGLDFALQTNLISLRVGYGAIANKVDCLTQLKKLHCLHNGIIGDYSKLTNLTDLSISLCNQNVVLPKGLTKLNINTFGIPRDDILVGLTNLVDLSTGNISIAILNTLTNLTRLANCDFPVSDKYPSHLTKLKELSVIDIYRSDHLLSKLVNLEKLMAFTCDFTDDDFKYLTNLTELDFVGGDLGFFKNSYRLTDKGLSQLTKLCKLRMANQFTDVGLSSLTRLEQLYIHERGAKITTKAFSTNNCIHITMMMTGEYYGKEFRKKDMKDLYIDEWSLI